MGPVSGEAAPSSGCRLQGAAKTLPLEPTSRGPGAECSFPQGLRADLPPPLRRNPEPSPSITARLQDQLCSKGHIHFQGTRGEDRRSSCWATQHPGLLRRGSSLCTAPAGWSPRGAGPVQRWPQAPLKGSSWQPVSKAPAKAGLPGALGWGPPPPGPACTLHQGQAAQRASGAACVPQHGILVSW